MWLVTVLEEQVFRQRRSPVTIRNYEVALRRWADCDVRCIGDVSVESAQRFVEVRLARNKVQSVGTDFSAMLAVLSHLERTGRMSAALLAQVRRVAPRAPKRRQFCAAYLTKDQVERFCAAADTEASFLVQFACYTGLRASELARLDWQDVDVRGRVLYVRSGKTGPRRVSLCAPAVDLLRGRQDSGGLVFGGVGARTLQDHVREGSQASGVHVTLTLCRHSRASWWVRGGVPIAIVAKQMGHSIAVCATHYAGLGEGYDPLVEQGAAG